MTDRNLTLTPINANDYLTDASHSTMALTDASGTIQTTYNYEPYGATTVYGTASDNPYQYTGRENDQNGLMYFRNRYLLTVGSFTQEDPIGLIAGQNAYLYALSAPTMYVDPLGLASVGFPGYNSKELGGPPGTVTFGSVPSNPNDPQSPSVPGVKYKYPADAPSNLYSDWLNGPQLNFPPQQNQLPDCFATNSCNNQPPTAPRCDKFSGCYLPPPNHPKDNPSDGK